MLLQPCQGNQAVAPAATLELRNDGNEPCEVISKKDGTVYKLDGNQVISIPLQKNLVSNSKLQFTVNKGGRSFTVYGVVKGPDSGLRRNSVDSAELKLGSSDENKRPDMARRPSLVAERRRSNPAVSIVETDPLVASTENLINDRLGFKDTQASLSPTTDASSTPKTPHAHLSALQREAAKKSKVLFVKRETAPIMLNVFDRLREGVLKVKTEPSLYHDVGLREKLWEVIDQYHPAWLNEGLRAITTEDAGEMSDETEPTGPTTERKRSLKQRVFDDIFSNQDIIDEQKEKRQGVFPENTDFVIRMSRHIVCKFLELVLFLDRAKQLNLLRAPYTCLFKPEAQSKASEQILVQFSVIVFSGEGDILRHLKKLDYCVTHKQTALDEYDTKIPKGELHAKLRDGVVLAMLVRSYDGRIDVLSQMRIPAKERLHCLMNNEKLLDALEGFEPALLETGRRGKMTKYDIADCNKEKTLAFVWKLVLKFGLWSLIDENVLLEEIRRVSYKHKSNLSWKRTIECLAMDEERGELAFQNLFSEEDEHQQRVHRLLLHWVQVVCAGYDRVPKVKNFSTTIADGSAFCALIHYYHPTLIPMDTIFLPDQNFAEGERLRKERKNFAVVNQAVDALGEVPIRLNSCNSKNPPAQQLGFACVAFLCSRLLGTSKEVKAAKKIQTVWMVARAKKMRTAESEKRARKLLRERADSKLEDALAAKEVLADKVLFKDLLTSPIAERQPQPSDVKSATDASLTGNTSASVALLDPPRQAASDIILPSPAESAVERARKQLEQAEEEKRQKSALQEELRRERESRKAAQEAAAAERRAKMHEEKAKREEQERRLRDEEQAKKAKVERDKRTRELAMEAARKEKLLEEEKHAHVVAEQKAREAALRLEESKAMEAALRDRLARLEVEKETAEKAAIRERRQREEAEKRIGEELRDKEQLEREAADIRKQIELELIRERGATAEQFALEQSKWLELNKRNSELSRLLEEAERHQQELASELGLREVEQEQYRIELEQQLVHEEEERVRLEQEIEVEREKARQLDHEKLQLEAEARFAAEQVARLEAEVEAFAATRDEDARVIEEKYKEELRQLAKEREERLRAEEHLRSEQGRLLIEQDRIERLQLEQKRLREQDEHLAQEREERLAKMAEDQRRNMEAEDRIFREKIDARKREEERLEELRKSADKELRELELSRQREEARIQEIRRRALEEESRRQDEERKLEETRRAGEQLRQEEARKLEQLRVQILQQEKENERRAGVMQKIDEAKRFIEAQRIEQAKRTADREVNHTPRGKAAKDVLQLRGNGATKTPRDSRLLSVGILKYPVQQLQTPALVEDIESQKRAKLVSWLQNPKYYSRIEEILLHDPEARRIIRSRECLKAIVWSLRKCERSDQWELRCLLRSLGGVFEEHEPSASDMNIHLASSLMDVLQTFYDKSEEFLLALRIFAVFWPSFVDEFHYRVKTLVDLLDTRRQIQRLCGVRDSVCEDNLDRLLSLTNTNQ